METGDNIVSQVPSNDEVIVRAATVDDADGIVRIYNSHMETGGATFDTVRWTTQKTITLLRQREKDGWFVAIDGTDVVGWASARQYSARFGYRFTCETAIYLAAAVIGSGIADLLQRRIETYCVDNDIHHAVARIIADNARSIAFHRRYGYEMVGIQREIGRMDDRWVDVAILQKIFDRATGSDDHRINAY